MLINELISNFSVENNKYECKVKLNIENSLNWLKTIAGFANSKGGTLIVGVEDKTNKVIGFELNELDNVKNVFYNQIKEHFNTIPNIDSETLEYIVHNKKRYILLFNIMESKVKPVILKYDGAPLIYVRRDGFTNYATVEEIINMAKYSLNPKYDLDKTDILFDFDNFKKLREFYNQNTNLELKIKELESINFYDENHYLYKGSNLFSDNYDGKDLRVVFTIYKGLTRGDDFIISSNEFKGNAIDCYKFLYDNVIFNMKHGFVKKDTYRIDIDGYPKRSLFEAIINSIAHKDYYIEGSAIYADLFKDRLVLSSPGSVYLNNELKKTYELDKFASKRRNELISNIFVLCHAMEAKGTGFEKIMQDYKDEDVRHKPFIYSKNNQFSIVLPDLLYEDGVDFDSEGIRLLSQIENPTRFDLSVLAYCYTNMHSIKEIAEYLNVSNSSFLRKNVIQNLVIQGFLTESKQANKTIYQTNNELVKLS